MEGIKEINFKWRKHTLPKFNLSLGCIDVESLELQRYYHGILYHYSDAQSLMNIFDSKEFWVSRGDFLDDSSELKKVPEILHELSQQINKEIAAGLLKEFLEWKIHLYILSLSYNADSLILWSNYAKFNGYNIGLDMSILNNLAETQALRMKYKLFHGMVIYDPNKQKEIIQGEINKLCGKWKGQLTVEFFAEIRETCTRLYLYSPFFKSHHFWPEQEYRYVFWPDIPNIEDNLVNYRVKNGVFIPYIGIPLIRDLTTKEEGIPLSVITVGPKLHPEIAMSGMKEFLMKNHYPQNVVPTEIKIQ